MAITLISTVDIAFVLTIIGLVTMVVSRALFTACERIFVSDFLLLLGMFVTVMGGIAIMVYIA